MAITYDLSAEQFSIDSGYSRYSSWVCGAREIVDHGEMVSIPAGRFMMGSENGFPHEQPIHEMAVAPFRISRTEITQKQYVEIMQVNPVFPRDRAADKPVVTTWYNARRYCNQRSIKEGLTPCYDTVTGACNFNADGYRLPTEEEWEYACRAGTTGEHYSVIDSIGWYKYNSDCNIQPVGKKAPNSFGLFDMSGNVEEFCNDLFKGNYSRENKEKIKGLIARYSEWSTSTDEQLSATKHGPPEYVGIKVVARGGDYCDGTDGKYMPIRSSYRSGISPKSIAGFRVVRSGK